MTVVLALVIGQAATAQTLVEGFTGSTRTARPRVLAPSTEKPNLPAPDTSRKLTWHSMEVEGPGIRVLHFPDFSVLPDYEHVAMLGISLPSPVVSVHDLSLIYEPDGRVIWKVLEGNWRIYQFGASPSGQVTWIPDMLREFKERRGYDLFPWLPALTGEVLCSPGETDRFLFDWRKTLRELFLVDPARLDGMDRKRTDGIPVSTFGKDSGPGVWADIRESASVAHLFGPQLVPGENLPGETLPVDMKSTVDTALLCGLNQFGAVDTKETWDGEREVWTDYLARSSFLLQQGSSKADILYYYGEESSATQQVPDIPEGYSYDFIQPEGLLHSVFPVDGRLTTESGRYYRVLVLGPDCRVMSGAILRRILYLAEKGVPVWGTVPEQAASLADNPVEFAALAERLRALVPDMPLDIALREKDIVPDCIAPAGWAFVHRETDEDDLFWIRNFSGASSTSVVMVQAGQGLVRVLDPATGEVRRINGYTAPENYRYFVMDMEEDDALCVAIGKTPEFALPVTPVGHKRLLTLSGPWDRIPGAPGTVTLRKNFSLSKFRMRNATSFELSLGDVRDLAHVYVNGHDLGTRWKAPFRLDVPADYLHPGVNTLEVKVVNLRPGDLPSYAVRKGVNAATSGLLGPVTVSAVR